MSIKNTVKVMNFHALLRVNNARKNVDHAFNYERNLKYIDEFKQFLSKILWFKKAF